MCVCVWEREKREVRTDRNEEEIKEELLKDRKYSRSGGERGRGQTDGRRIPSIDSDTEDRDRRIEDGRGIWIFVLLSI